jgi:glucose dehydrogenase
MCDRGRHARDRESSALGRDWRQSYYSPLTGINADNIAQLGYAWGYDLEFSSTLEATPLVIDGVMYTGGNAGRTSALDAPTGALRWKFEPTLDSRIHRELRKLHLGTTVGAGRRKEGKLSSAASGNVAVLTFPCFSLPAPKSQI